MRRHREHVETRLRLERGALRLIDETVAKARAEFEESNVLQPEIDRQRVLELLIEQRLEDLRCDDSVLALQGAPVRRRVRGASLSLAGRILRGVPAAGGGD